MSFTHNPSSWRRRSRVVNCLVHCTPVICAAGCSRAPTFNILGSFFPSWLLCGVVGIVLAAAVRLWFVRIKFEQQLSPLIVVYPCLAGLFTFTLWLVFFS